jgi:hypothetical protein
MPGNDFRVLLLLALLAAGNAGIRDYRVFTSVIVRKGLEDFPVGFVLPSLRR